jgi:mevalonate kinase
MFLDEEEDLALKAVKALEDRNLDLLGSLMDKNQDLLAKLEVSHESLEKLIKTAKNAGALGAKLTGAGGGGCMIALTRLEDQLKIAEAIRKAGGTPYIVGVDHRGLKVWSREEA